MSAPSSRVNRHRFYRFACFAVALLLRVFTRCRVEGLERVPASGPLLVVANHLNFVDPPVLGAVFPRRVVFMAKEELFGVPVIGPIVQWYGAFSVKRGTPDRQALRTALDALRAGEVIGMFPEGTRSKTGRMNDAHPGAALLAVLSSSMVLPVAIVGTDQLRSIAVFLRRPAITITVGEPFVVDRGPSGKGSLDEATQRMMARVALLLPPSRPGRILRPGLHAAGAEPLSVTLSGMNARAEKTSNASRCVGAGRRARPGPRAMVPSDEVPGRHGGRPLQPPMDTCRARSGAGGPLAHEGVEGHSKCGVVASVSPGSIAEECGILPGDALLSVNGVSPRDVIDCRYLSSALDVTLVYLRGDREHEVEIEKDWDEGLGIEFEEPLFDGVHLCANRCRFCFVKNLPSGLRPTLYIKDDDYRLSFLFGNFVTLTNVTDEELGRIHTQRLSPLFVSVHATDREARNRLLGVEAPGILDQIDRLGDLGVEIHAQVVLCPGLNDGEVLDRTIAELSARHQVVNSIAIVPVGLTRFARDPGLRPFGEEEARLLVQRLSPLQRRFRRSLGRSLLQLSDEFYGLGRLPVPPAAWYDGYPQLENGVGMVRRLLSGWASRRRRLPVALPQARLVGWACGTSAYLTLEAIAQEMRRVDGLTVEVHPVENEFFGTTVTVSGLLTGADVLPVVRERGVDQWVLPRAMFDESGLQTLDGASLAQILVEASAPVAVAGSAGELTRVTLFGE